MAEPSRRCALAQPGAGVSHRRRRHPARIRPQAGGNRPCRTGSG